MYVSFFNHTNLQSKVVERIDIFLYLYIKTISINGGSIIFEFLSYICSKFLSYKYVKYYTRLFFPTYLQYLHALYVHPYNIDVIKYTARSRGEARAFN
jgi:hypothetical protein